MEVRSETQPEVKPKPKLHIWNQILEDDELSEKLNASMSKLGDEFARRFIRKRGKKNKKKKKGKKNSNSISNVTNNEVGKTNGATISKSKDLKPEVESQNVGHSQKPQSNQANLRTENNQQRAGGVSQKSKRKSKLPDNVLQAEAKNICKKLKEKRIDLIIRTIRHLGLDEAMKLCSEVLTIEEAGGLMTLNGIRRRTPGGIFFHLIRSNGRYEASIVSKIFKDGETKEPVFKQRNKTRNIVATAKNVTDVKVTNEKSSIMNGSTVQPIEEASSNVPVPMVSPFIPIVPIVPIESIKPIEPISPSPLTQSAQPIEEQPVESINPATQAPEAINPDTRMDQDDDDYENSNLVIVEYDSAAIENGNANPNSEQLVKCTFPVNPISPDLNILYQQPSSQTVNSNVPIFSSNRISVDA